MAASAFDDKARPPGASEVARVLGETAPLWTELRAWTAERFAPLTEEWVYGGARYGWSLRLKQKKRAVLYLTPGAGFFRASLALGEKAAAAATLAGLPATVLRLIEEAPRYPEGRAFRLEVKNARQRRWVEKVAELKMAEVVDGRLVIFDRE